LYRGGFSLVAVLTGILLIAAANSPPRILSLVLRFPVLRWFGKISYGLYLWHWIVIRTTTFYYLGYWEPWAKLALAVAISAASFYLVELRFNRMKSRFSLGSMPASDPSPHITVSPERTALSLPSAS
jgi:peptidoglycan/LPS O-acetylase OafA/YrhL